MESADSRQQQPLEPAVHKAADTMLSFVLPGCGVGRPLSMAPHRLSPMQRQSPMSVPNAASVLNVSPQCQSPMQHQFPMQRQSLGITLWANELAGPWLLVTAWLQSSTFAWVRWRPGQGGSQVSDIMPGRSADENSLWLL